MTTPQGMLADELASISGRCSLEADRETIIKAATELRRQAAAPQGREALDIDALREKLPRYVSDLAREIAGEAEYDLQDEHREAKNYTLARWFDAVIAALTPAVAPKRKFDETGMGKRLREIVGQETNPPLWIYVTKDQIPILEAIADRLDWLEGLYAPFITEHPAQPAIPACTLPEGNSK